MLGSKLPLIVVCGVDVSASGLLSKVALVLFPFCDSFCGLTLSPICFTLPMVVVHGVLNKKAY